MNRTVLGLLVLVSSAVQADRVIPPRPQNFAYKMPLVLEKKASVYSALLPEAFYRSLQRGYAMDAAAFTADGRQILADFEHELSKTETSERWERPPFFPVYREQGLGGDETSLQLNEDKNGKVLSVRIASPRGGKPAKPAGKPGTEVAYLVDLRKLKEAVDHLELDWHSDDVNRVLQLHVEGSDDLSHWWSLSGTATLARLSYRGERVEQNSVDLEGSRAKFLRLSWNAGAPFVLEGLRARVSVVRVESPRSWTPAQPGAAVLPANSAEAVSEWIYDAGGVFPVDRVKVLFPESNTSSRVAIMAAREATGPWASLGSGLQFRLTSSSGSEVQAQPVLLPTPMGNSFGYRWFKLKLEGGAGAAPVLKTAPELQLGWAAHTLVFVAQGDGPFFLAFGSARYQHMSRGSPREILLGAEGPNAKPAMASLGARAELGGASQFTPAPVEDPQSRRRMLLWVVLIAGVIGMGFLAYRLARDLKPAA